MNKFNKMVYISIPKTGTNTIHMLRGFREYNHMKAISIVRKIGLEEFCKRGSFCFIRNPLELITSWYCYHTTNNYIPKSEGIAFYPRTINEWICEKNLSTHWEKFRHKFKNPYWDLSNPLFQYSWIYCLC